jgi:hypothetical protein
MHFFTDWNLVCYKIYLRNFCETLCNAKHTARRKWKFASVLYIKNLLKDIR